MKKNTRYIGIEIWTVCVMLLFLFSGNFAEVFGASASNEYFPKPGTAKIFKATFDSEKPGSLPSRNIIFIVSRYLEPTIIEGKKVFPEAVKAFDTLKDARSHFKSKGDPAFVKYHRLNKKDGSMFLWATQTKNGLKRENTINPNLPRNIQEGTRWNATYNNIPFVGENKPLHVSLFIERIRWTEKLPDTDYTFENCVVVRGKGQESVTKTNADSATITVRFDYKEVKVHTPNVGVIFTKLATMGTDANDPMKKIESSGDIEGIVDNFLKYKRVESFTTQLIHYSLPEP